MALSLLWYIHVIMYLMFFKLILKNVSEVQLTGNDILMLSLTYLAYLDISITSFLNNKCFKPATTADCSLQLNISAKLWVRQTLLSFLLCTKYAPVKLV